MRSTVILAAGATFVASVALVPHLSAAEKSSIPPEVIASRTAVQQFGSTLKTSLQQAIQDGGLVSGIAVCHDKAAQIAADMAQSTGMLIGRTSLKIRNPENAPDNWEMAVLKQFEARKAQGEAIDKLEFFAVIDDDQGQKTFRYMKAIPTAALCLGCHGEHLTAEVDAKLKELYPNDAARGFKEGDLRGAFTLAQPLP